MNKYAIDLGERVGATAAEAGLGVLTVELANAPVWWAVLLVPVLAGLKGGLARWLGRADTAALLPAGTDPASR